MKKGKTLMRRIGKLTSGGDCQSLNATMRGVAKSLYKMFDDIEIVGFEDGYKGLMYADYRIMKQSDFSGILTRGGTILGTSRQPFKLMRTPDENGLDKVEAMKHTYYTSPTAKRPIRRSRKLSIFSLPSWISETHRPSVVPQSISRTMTS